MVVVLSPNALHMIPNVAVVVATLSRSVMNTNAMQVVGHVLQDLVLLVQEILLGANLILQGCHLRLDVTELLIEHFLNQLRRLDGFLL